MRIVSLLSSATEILFAIGAGDDVVAVSHECDYPPEATTLPRATRSIVDSSRSSGEIDRQVKQLVKAGATLYEIDGELIRKLKPDLIVAQAQCDVCAVRYQHVVDFVASEPTLRDTKVIALNPQYFMQIFQDVLYIGQATNRYDAAIRFKERLLGRHAEVLNKTNHALNCHRPRVVVIEWTEPLMAAGNWTPELVQAAGGEPLLGAAGQHSGYITWPDVIAARPEVLIAAPCGFNLDRSLLEARRLMDLPGYYGLPAVKTGQTFVVDGNAYLNRSGPRVVDSLEILAHLIRPELFDPPGGELADGRAWARLRTTL
jgi:iron complex transport system substrate-binding protein